MEVTVILYSGIEFGMIFCCWRYVLLRSYSIYFSKFLYLIYLKNEFFGSCVVLGGEGWWLVISYFVVFEEILFIIFIFNIFLLVYRIDLSNFVYWDFLDIGFIFRKVF